MIQGQSFTAFPKMERFQEFFFLQGFRSLRDVILSLWSLLFVRSGFRTQAVPEEPLREFFPEDSQEAWALSLREFFSPGSSLTIVGGGWITVLP